MSRITVLKTYKIYIGGQFPRTESGRYYEPRTKSGKSLGNICLCSRKDVRNAVVAARKAQGSWSEKSAFNRSQILYRIAEMMEGRKAQFIEELMLQGSTQKNAEKEMEQSIDRMVYYAGWCDKYQALVSSVNPVASSHFNFSAAEAMGVVGIQISDSHALLNLISLVAPVIAGGNTCVVLASENLPLCSVTFAEVLNSSDVPGGVVNILTGTQNETLPTLSTHMDVNALVTDNLKIEEYKEVQINAVENLKRTFNYKENWSELESQGLKFIANIQEIKTTWHPIENIGGASSSY